jgi:hypothetical protein
MTIDLNHGSGSLDGKPTDANNVSTVVNGYINDALYRRYVERKARENRNYVGMSELGDKCMRRVHYAYTGAPLPPITGEKLRQFEMGLEFERMVYEWLVAAGFQIKSRNSRGEQFEFSTAGGRIRGHIDGVIVGGPPVPGLIYPALWENKALKHKYWNGIVKHGLWKAEPKYYGQCQEYMAYGQLANTLFTTINKDTAEIFNLIVRLNMKDAQKYSDRGVAIVKSIDDRRAPPRISANKDFFVCKQCEFHNHCWSTAT